MAVDVKNHDVDTDAVAGAVSELAALFEKVRKDSGRLEKIREKMYPLLEQISGLKAIGIGEVKSAAYIADEVRKDIDEGHLEESWMKFRDKILPLEGIGRWV